MSLLLTLVLAAAQPEVAWLCAASGDGDQAELRFQRVGAEALAPPVARFTIVPRSTVTGVLLPKSRTVLAVALLEPAADETWAFSLLRLEAGTAPRVLVNRLAAATRPLVTGSGRVFVERGTALPAEAQLQAPHTWRRDAVSIDEVNPMSGATRTVFSAVGFYAAIAGTLGPELFVVLVDESGAHLDAINLETNERRTLRASMPPLAHDFAVDPVHGALLYTLGDARTHQWHIEALDLKTSKLRALATGPVAAMLPTVFPDGRVAFAARAGSGLTQVGSDSGRLLLGPQGPGFERVRFFHGGLALGLHERPSDFPTPLAVSLDDGAPQILLAPTQMRLELAGVVP